MTKEQIIAYLGHDFDATIRVMRQSLESGIPLLDTTNDSLLSHSGKLMRPILSLLMAKACGTPDEDSHKYAAAVELFHNATLMHDDVADGSSQRRGRPTVSALIGASAAVLVGDFWLSKAVELIVSTRNYRPVVKLFAKTLTDLAEGEMLQLEKAGTSDTSEEDYLRIIYSKTASLFVTAVCSGAMSVGAKPEFLDAAREYATCLGLAFQIKDDILDYKGTDELGKPVGVDLKEQKITLPLLGAMQGSPRETDIRQLIKDIPSHPENEQVVRDFVMASDGIAYSYAKLDGYVESAVKALQPLPDSPAKEMLCSIARYNISRTI